MLVSPRPALASALALDAVEPTAARPATRPPARLAFGPERPAPTWVDTPWLHAGLRRPEVASVRLRGLRTGAHVKDAAGPAREPTAGQRIDALLGGLEAVHTRASTAGRTVDLDAGEARALLRDALGAGFPAEHVQGASVDPGGQVRVRFDDGFAWKVGGHTLHFGDNNDAHELRGQLYRDQAGHGLRIGEDNGFEGDWGVDIERVNVDTAGRVWVKPLGHDARPID